MLNRIAFSIKYLSSDMIQYNFTRNPNWNSRCRQFAENLNQINHDVSHEHVIYIDAE